MDTKLKKSHKLATVIITLCILLPAFLLTSLYPTIGDAMQKKAAKYDKLNHQLREEYENEEKEEPIKEWTFKNQFVNYVMETSYYLYGRCIEEAYGTKVDYTVFNAYQWMDDYEKVQDETRYYAKYHAGDQLIERKNADVLAESDTLGYLTLTFDSYGYLSEVLVEGKLLVEDDYDESTDLQTKAKKSMDQYKNNVAYYNRSHEVEIDEHQLVPKNFVITFALDEYCDFVYISSEGREDHYYYYSPEELAVEVGAVWVVAAAIIFVALVALLLPFLKKLETGWGKLFCIPLEVVAAFTALGCFGTYLMFSVMSWTCGYEHNFDIVILGYEITQKSQYILMLVANFLGWALLFLIEYIVIAAIRQFLCRPKYYLQNRILCIHVLKWLGKKIGALMKWFTTIDLSKKMRATVLKLVGANYIVLLVLYTVLEGTVHYLDEEYWLFGAFVLLVYSLILYVLLLKWGMTMKKQYNSVLSATNSMAEGNLKISLEENLGVFQPIGDSVQKVQQGFQKAVMEEAKSQNMKTELITNVSHDLKTPLTAIITYVDLLKKEDTTEEQRKSYIETLEQKSQRLKALIEDLFEVSKAHSGNVVMNFMDVDVVSLIKQVKSEMNDQMEASGLIFRFNLPEEKVILSLDGQRTYRVFENLLSNALKYAMPYSRVYVDMLVGDSTVKVIFRNVSAQELDFDPQRLTERFVRGDASRNSEGSGLGLAIAKSFMELQHGKLNIEVDGDLFKVTLVWNK